jgi:heme exporter protein A
MTSSLLTIEGLNLQRGGRRLLENFSLTVSAGDFIQVEGSNGSGKTTLLRFMAGLSSFGGEQNIQRSACTVQYLGHKPATKSLLTPRENLNWYCQGHGWDLAGVDSALEQVGLFGYEDAPCFQLSAGQRRRVGLARLYLGEAQLWLLDEPFTSIDSDGVERLAHHLEARAQAGAAVVLTSHQTVPVSYPVKKFQLDGAQ